MSCPGNKDTKGSLEKDNKTSQTTGPSENLTETDGYFCSSSFSMDPAEEYKMNHKRRGLALIFNQEHFYWHLRMPPRNGTNADRSNLVKRFEDLNFEVQAFDNLKVEEVLDQISQAAEANHADADCFVCVFLSHGENDHVYAYDDKITIQDITALFKGDKCKSLVGKPKIFILQACRGDKHDDPVTPMDVVDSEVKTNEVVVDAGVVYTLPAGADFIMCYSVAEDLTAILVPGVPVQATIPTARRSTAPGTSRTCVGPCGSSEIPWSSRSS
ncbi:caspase-6 isoform X3 [Oncorhynchus tshawytscha]|uniref:caspase-6 isoform X3 n=1 Tax=Oncorhynchus tshawytscha TaxID=74940 RepID=UPI000D09AABD|nr:caspase-6 isoform X3 [Oncorhynchus tshawytscha]